MSWTVATRSWAACGSVLYTSNGPRTDGVGDRATEAWSGNDHRPGANVAAEALPSRGSSHVCPTSKGDQRRESHLRMERTGNRDLRMSGTRTRAQRRSKNATAGSTFNPLSCDTRIGGRTCHERTDKPRPGHAHQTKVFKGIPRTMPKKKTRPSFPPRHDHMPSPDRPATPGKTSSSLWTRENKPRKLKWHLNSGL